jgi:hypothetical protein
MNVVYYGGAEPGDADVVAIDSEIIEGLKNRNKRDDLPHKPAAPCRTRSRRPSAPRSSAGFATPGCCAPPPRMRSMR